jgi:ankyrin repeat protein
MLLEHKADINPRCYSGSTPLLCASEGGDPDVLRLLLDRNADVHVRDNEGNTPLHFAALHEDLEVARRLLERDAEVNIRNNNGSTPLLGALRTETLTLRAYCWTTMQMRTRTTTRETLHYIFQHYMDTLRSLGGFSSTTRRSIPGVTMDLPHFLRALGAGNSDVAWLLLDYNADVHMHDNEGNTPLQLCSVQWSPRGFS